MIKHSLRQCCGTAKSARPVAWARIGNTAVTALSVMFSLPAGWVAAQDVGGKAPFGEELLVPDAAEPDRDAAEPDRVEKGWLAGDFATGDWGGLRTKLAEQGITFEGGLVLDFLALTSGGDSGGGNWDYAGYTYLGTNFDLDTLAGLPGLSFYVEAGWSFGEDLGRKTGTVFSPAQAFTVDLLQQRADEFPVALAGVLLRVFDRRENGGAIAGLFNRIVWHDVLLGELR